MMTVKRPHVLILGAGLGGLTLAQALRKQGIPYQIFERDASLESRSQGWAIALHSILPELRAALPDDLPPLTSTNHLLPLDRKTQFTMFFADGRTMVAETNAQREILRANRLQLRKYLTTNIDIQYDKHATRVEEHDDKLTLHFSDGTSATGDVLVGADGIHSYVRRYLLGPDDKLNTLPNGLIVGEATLDKEQYLRQMEISNSAYVTLHGGDRPRIFVGLNSVAEDEATAAYYWLLSWQDPDAVHGSHWTQLASQQEMYDYAIKQTEFMGPRLNEIVRLTKPSGMVHPPIIIRDMIPPKIRKGRIALLGDAIHPMSPARGEGGNNALFDALYLAKTLQKSDEDSLVANLAQYQEEVRERGENAVRDSRQASQSRVDPASTAWNRNAEASIWGAAETRAST